MLYVYKITIILYLPLTIILLIKHTAMNNYYQTPEVRDGCSNGLRNHSMR